MSLPWSSRGDGVKSRKKADFGLQTPRTAMVNHY
jgi:hypothetical protein